MKYNIFLKEWLELYIKTGIKSRTYETYQYTINQYINPFLGNFELGDLSHSILQKYICSLAEDKDNHKGLSTSTLKMIWRLISSSLTVALDEGKILDKSFSKVKLPRQAEKQISAFTLLEQKKIEKAINVACHPKHLGILICLYTGLRLGEMCGLKWEDIDFKNGTMQISRTVYLQTKNHSSKLIFDTPKTKSSIRTIPIPQFLLSILKEEKKKSQQKLCNKESVRSESQTNNKSLTQQKEACLSEFVISDKLGNAIIPRTYQYAFTALQKRAGVSQKGFHSLRHTFAIRALECGMDVKSLSEILGHKNPTITLTRYSHSMMSYKKTMMNKIGKLFE